MRITITLLFLIFFSQLANATPPNRQFNYVPNTTIDTSQNNANENALYSYLQAGVDTYAAGSITGADISGSASIPYSSLSLGNSITRTDIASGYLLLSSGDVFMRVSGSCPTGTTDISATYSNRYVKINATPGTTSGVVLTGTTDGTAITQANLPSYNLTFTRYDGNGSGLTGVQGTTNGANAVSQNVASAGSGTAHTHTFSTATTLEPTSVTLRLCQVN